MGESDISSPLLSTAPYRINSVWFLSGIWPDEGGHIIVPGWASDFLPFTDRIKGPLYQPPCWGLAQSVFHISLHLQGIEIFKDVVGRYVWKLVLEVRVFCVFVERVAGLPTLEGR